MGIQDNDWVGSTTIMAYIVQSVVVHAFKRGLRGLSYR